ncbi:MAG: peptidase family M48-domain-containing protein [Monoraphidium minutum]|nr:MAG: peptidase family M48-domain-containing protein [Monoraphidium minutum]
MGLMRALLAAAGRGARSRAPTLAEGAAVAPPWWCKRQGAARGVWQDRSGYEHFDGRGPVYNRAWVVKAAGGAAVVGGAYYFRSLEEVPYTHRRHAIFISPATEAQLGEQLWGETIRDAQASRKLLPPSHPLSQLVQRVGRRIAAVASDGEGGGYNGHMKAQQWEFAVIDDPQVNAFVAPGGKVVVFTGLLQIMKSEDELAAVIAHEAAHVVARHIAENLSRAQMIGLTTIVARLLLGIPLPPDLLVVSFFLPHSRSNEAEADAIGIRLLARACYDPEANVRMLQALEAQERARGGGGGSGPALLRTHPLTEDRVVRVRALLPEAYKIYRGHCSAIQSGWQELMRAF